MNNFFKLNPEKRIGYKKLSAADLGLSSTSHQTHIGLFDNMLTFLPNAHIEKYAILIYNDFCDILSCEYGKINRKNGKIDAPKVQSGNRSKNTVVRKIRSFAKEKPNLDWFIVWFGTDSNELVFWLISSDSQDYLFLNAILSDFKVYDESTPSFSQIINYLESKINGVSVNILKELEIASQVGDFKNKYKTLYLDKAAARCRDIGRRGEELIAQYLDKQKNTGKINDYIWENKSHEVGKPYDFIIVSTHATEYFIDVKSTSFDFSQEIVFSENEISFVTELHDDSRYSAFRVFDIYEEQKKLAICRKCYSYLSKLDSRVKIFHKDLAKRRAFTKSLNIAIKPEICFKTIDNTIVL